MLRQLRFVLEQQPFDHVDDGALLGTGQIGHGRLYDLPCAMPAAAEAAGIGNWFNSLNDQAHPGAVVWRVKLSHADFGLCCGTKPCVREAFS